MGNTKLQELTDKLYQEGLEKGRAEADSLVSEAKSQAEKIVADARAEAEKIMEQAHHKAEDTEKNAMTEIALAGRQAKAKIKSEIENMIVASADLSNSDKTDGFLKKTKACTKGDFTGQFSQAGV